MGRNEEEIAKQLDKFTTAVPSSGAEAVNRPYDKLLDADFDYVNAVYQRGAAFLYGLEQVIGRENFHKFLQAYYQEYSFREVHTEDFITTLTPCVAKNQTAQELIERSSG